MSIFLLAARFKFSIHRLVIGLMVAVPFSAFAAGMAKDPLSDLVSTGVNHAFAIESERLRLEIARNQQ